MRRNRFFPFSVFFLFRSVLRCFRARARERGVVAKHAVLVEEKEEEEVVVVVVEEEEPRVEEEVSMGESRL